jgi:hypothetical protein
LLCTSPLENLDEYAPIQGKIAAKTAFANFFVLYPFLDNLITNMKHVSLNRKNRFHAQHLLPRAVDKLTDDHIATIYEAYQADIYLSLEDFRRKVARWRTQWVITKCNDLPTTLCTTLDSVNQVLYPSIDTILIKLCVLSTMPVASATAERSFSVQRCLKNYVRSTMKNDRLLVQRNSPILFWRFRGAIGFGSLSTTSPGHTIRYIKRFG